ncbi:hypothetical protein AB1Y20_007178 [Prymnesium parvum]|uniref:Uncharacterized protein n=1 Tax=Prymnesium parvum TaxID=97485 RepID=A0AB34IX27_PRYPA
MRYPLAVALLVAPASAKRACPPVPLPCSPRCLLSEAQRHCRYCKCKACAMCSRPLPAPTAASHTSPRPLLGRSRRWAPSDASPAATNASAASRVLRLLGYIPAAQLPLAFGGDPADFSLAPAAFPTLSRAEAAAAGPPLLSLRAQRRAAAAGTRARRDVSWLASPVAGLLPRTAARPPTPRARAARRRRARRPQHNRTSAPPPPRRRGGRTDKRKAAAPRRPRKKKKKPKPPKAKAKAKRKRAGGAAATRRREPPD